MEREIAKHYCMRCKYESFCERGSERVAKVEEILLESAKEYVK